MELFERTCDEARDWMREKMTQLETAVIGKSFEHMNHLLLCLFPLKRGFLVRSHG